MKQNLLAFFIVLIILGAAYVVKTQQSPNPVDAKKTPTTSSVSPSQKDEESSLSDAQEEVNEQESGHSKKKLAEVFKAEKLPQYTQTTLPPQSARPGRYARPTLDVAYWKKQYAGGPIDARKWDREWHRGFWTSWFDGKNDEVAEKYITTIGPLGLRVYMHDKTWFNEPAFMRHAPDVLKSNTGELLANALEVVDVLPGSPSEAPPG